MRFRDFRWSVRGGRGVYAVGLVAVWLATAPVACSGGAPSVPAPASAKATLGGSSTHAIHVFVKQPDGSSKQVDFGRGTEVHFGGAQAARLGQLPSDGGTGNVTGQPLSSGVNTAGFS